MNVLLICLFTIPSVSFLIILAVWLYDLTGAFRIKRATIANLHRVIRGFVA